MRSANGDFSPLALPCHSFTGTQVVKDAIACGDSPGGAALDNLRSRENPRFEIFRLTARSRAVGFGVFLRFRPYCRQCYQAA